MVFFRMSILAKLRDKVMLKLGYERIQGKRFSFLESPVLHSRMHEGEAAFTVCAHMFWAYGELSQLEKLAAASFVKNGYQLKLWSYDLISGLPDGVTLCDAREILAEERVFLNKRGSFASFSDLFRYALLSEHGGLWVDTDVVALAHAQDLQPFSKSGFWVSEGNRASKRLSSPNNNVIFHPNPVPGDLIDLAWAVSDRFNVEHLNWGEIGPGLLSYLALAYPNIAPPIMEPAFANPLGYWETPKKLLEPGRHVPQNTWFFHCYNERWRQKAIDKNKPYPKGSIMDQLSVMSGFGSEMR